MKGFTSDYAQVACENNLTGLVAERYRMYMQIRWPEGQDYSYAVEWVERFRQGIEYLASDSVGVNVLKGMDKSIRGEI